MIGYAEPHSELIGPSTTMAGTHSLVSLAPVTMDDTSYVTEERCTSTGIGVGMRLKHEHWYIK
jgi:hypothetical protein